jgi:hypothetical protein
LVAAVRFAAPGTLEASLKNNVSTRHFNATLHATPTRKHGWHQENI